VDQRLGQLIQVTGPVRLTLEPQPSRRLTIEYLIEIAKRRGLKRIQGRLVDGSRITRYPSISQQSQDVPLTQSNVPEPAQVIESAIRPGSPTEQATGTSHPLFEGSQWQLTNSKSLQSTIEQQPSRDAQGRHQIHDSRSGGITPEELRDPGKLRQRAPGIGHAARPQPLITHETETPGKLLIPGSGREAAYPHQEDDD